MLELGKPFSFKLQMSKRKFCFNYNLSLSSMYWTTLIAINSFEQERQLMKFASCPEVHLYLASKVSRILKSIRVYHLVDFASCFFLQLN